MSIKIKTWKILYNSFLIKNVHQLRYFYSTLVLGYSYWFVHNGNKHDFFINIFCGCITYCFWNSNFEIRLPRFIFWDSIRLSRLIEFSSSTAFEPPNQRRIPFVTILKRLGRCEQIRTQFPTILVSYQQKFPQVLFGQISMVKMLRCFDFLLELDDSLPNFFWIWFHMVASGTSELRVFRHFWHRGSAFLASEIEIGTVFHLASGWEVLIASHTSALEPILFCHQKTHFELQEKAKL